MDKRCTVEACKREAETHCYHCSRDVCSKHFLEHKQSIQEQLPSFVDEVNVTYERLRRTDKKQTTFVPPSLVHAYGQLEQWRVDCHQHIDLVYDQARQQMDSIAENCKHAETQKTIGILESLEKMREQMKEMLKEEDVTHRQLETMKKQLEEIKKKEQESITYPDIRLTTQKIDVKNHVSVNAEIKRPINEQRHPRNSLVEMKRSINEQRDPRSSLADIKRPINEQQNPRSTFTALKKMLAAQQRYTSTTSSTEETDKCPVCDIIFPRSITNDERNRHADRHYSD